MYQYLEQSKPFVISALVGIAIILLFGMDKPGFENQIITEGEKASLLK